MTAQKVHWGSFDYKVPSRHGWPSWGNFVEQNAHHAGDHVSLLHAKTQTAVSSPLKHQETRCRKGKSRAYLELVTDNTTSQLCCQRRV
eukprot:4509502-Amphidinium_carterae.1